jgi:hypothetical protein
LAIYCANKYGLKNLNKIYTVKNILEDSVDKNYQNIFSKNFWLRRIEQHKISNLYKKKKFNGFDFLFCNAINLIIK